MKKLAILGLGHIGKYVLDVLSNDTSIAANGFDLSNGYDLSNTDVLETIIKDANGVLASTPFFLNKKIAEVCNKYGVDYFDLTESVDVTNYVKTLNNARFVTQCGLAPGMVSIIANHLASSFKKVKDINIRVGALPKNSSNHIGYYRTWNTEGLINEYIRKCPAIINGNYVEVEPLTDTENIILNGLHLEAANTSGGLGSLAQTYINKADRVNYKTLRYPGHWKIMQFLKDDLNLSNNFDTFVKLFNENLPQTMEDYVYILINVTGYDSNDNLKIKQYSNVLENTTDMTAIQLTTGSGVMCVIDSWNKGHLNHLHGWVRQEELDFQSIWNSQYNCYNKEIIL